MAHYAKVLNGVVTQVIVAEPEFFDTFIDNSPGEWIQTSYNTRGGQHYNPETGEVDDGTPLRKNYAGKGHIYDASLDAFYEPQPFPSWTLDEQTCLWSAPITKPDTNKVYWDEDAYQADTNNPKTAGWVEMTNE